MAKRQALVKFEDPAAERGVKSRAVVLPAGIRLVQRLAAGGYPMYRICTALGLHKDAFRRARQRQPELQEAVDIGYGDLEVECVDALLTAMRNGAYAPAMFLLKTRMHYREVGPIDGGPDARVQINLQIPPGMTREEAAKLIREINPDQKQLPPPFVDAEFEEIQQPKITRG